MEYYIPLLIIYFIFGIGELAKPVRNRNKYTFWLLLPMFVLTAFRSVNIGNDTLPYSMSYETVEKISTLKELLVYKVNSHMEIGYILSCFAVSKVGIGYFGFQIISSAFIYYSFYKFFSKFSPNIALCCFLFMATFRMGGTMNVVRMYMTMAVLLYSVPCILKHQWIRFGLLVAIASTFHTSAVLFAVMYPLCVLKYNRFIVLSLVIGSGVILYLGSVFFHWLTESIDMYENYVTEARFEDMNMLAVTVGLVTILVVYMFASQVGFFKKPQYVHGNVRSKKKYVTIDYYLHMAILVALCISIIGLSNNIMGRISAYFGITTSLVIASSINLIRDKNVKLFVYVVCTALYFAYFITVLILRPQWNHISPYEWGF